MLHETHTLCNPKPSLFETNLNETNDEKVEKKHSILIEYVLLAHFSHSPIKIDSILLNVENRIVVCLDYTKYDTQRIRMRKK